MSLLAMLLSQIWPECGTAGIGGLPLPPPMDLTRIERPATPNTALAAPAGFQPSPDVITHFSGDPAKTYAALRRIAAATPRAFPHAAHDDRMQAHFVIRSAAANFPDLVTIAVTPDGGVVIWSRSVYGRKDFGVNRARIDDWLTTLARDLARD